MKKNRCCDGIMPFYDQILKKMKLTLLLLLLTVLSGIAADTYSQSTKLTLKLENVRIEDLLSQIEDKSEFRFFYNEEIDLDKKVSVNSSDETLVNILDKILNNTGIRYEVIGRQVILTNSSGIASVSQQSKTVTGKVTDSSGEPLPGVTVVVKGTTNGTITGADGNYSLGNITADATLLFSFVGMKSQEIPVAGKTGINVTMVEETIGLEEVVAIGYGTAKKSDITGAVATLQGDAVAERRTTQVSQALQGAISGVMVTRDNNTPGSSATINIRGITTIGDSSPLIIMDGVPINNINDINPNDIQDISVLKDAASASIYGSRAAAGVILVTTKRAKAGELNLSYNAEYGVETPTQLPVYVDVIRYMQIANELRWNDNGNTSDEYPLYAKDIVDNYMSLNAENPDLYPNTDWVGLILEKYAPKQSHTLSISAGTKAIRSKLTLAYDKTDALYMNHTYERITSRFNNDITINKFLSATLDMYFKRSIREQPSLDPMYNMLIAAPVYAAEWSDGRVAEGKTGNNIYGQIKYGGFRNNWYNQVGGKLSLDFTPFDGFKLSAILSPNLGFDKAKNFQKKVSYTDWEDPTSILGTLEWAKTTNLYESRNDNYQVTTQFLANYTKTIKEHNLNILAGYENYYSYYENLSASREQYDLEAFPYLDLGPLTYRGNSGNAYENAYRSWLGRVMYNYQSKYFIQGNIRFDASSRFHTDYRWGSFPSLSAGWVISEESFMKDISWLSFLKLRGSWGTLGNERIGNYPYQATIAFSDAIFHQGSTVVASQTAAQWQYAIRDISWEKTESFDVGFDAGLFDNKLRLTGDYYRKTTKDMLLALEIPDYMGFSNPDQNTGKMETKGWEFEANYNNRIGQVNYSVGFNISDFKSTMGDLGGTEFLGDQIKIKGSEFNEWYGYISDGLFQTEEEVTTSPKTSESVRPGDVKYKDISGPDGVPDGSITPEYDRVLLGGSLPRYMYGANIRLEYKGFDFSMVIQGVGKQNVRLEGLMVQPLMENWGHVPKILDGNFWSMYNTQEENLMVKYPRISQTSRGNNFAMSDYWLINGAYLRLKNISLGYTLPKSIVQSIKMNNVRFYATISDLYTFDNFPKGWDPEVSSSGYPITSSFIFGVAVKF
ncbi:MAG TPA: SusC/RagA family TonB-linked outer membrane protein [Prolixibacteraceae bacterium]|nr:MAG: SusC/RagA family TonB-linked outer membrane protein [Bacteroidetes bacterium GWA2_42_15]OFX98518.1 MAG: SusC/RagA family TonB-linked outer membrane protein [Bacteroidetes bacterium GWE2_42_39]HBL75300.1 SusC/RagA family TonB-linked outer membrane protein [Prolixibacteraceae bacterium]HCU61828.1 SusC/RagA family TonB-linked outer membrane protein [Prolixibacteraceae bacterium]